MNLLEDGLAILNCIEAKVKKPRGSAAIEMPGGNNSFLVA
jgi:hypothetical protein